MSLRSFEHALARLQKVLKLLDEAEKASYAGKVREYAEWLSSYEQNGICFNPDGAAFQAFLTPVKEAEDLERRGAYNDALFAGYEALRVLSSPKLRAARCVALADLPRAPDDFLGDIPGIPGSGGVASGP